jgi:hypothetical protein
MRKVTVRDLFALNVPIHTFQFQIVQGPMHELIPEVTFKLDLLILIPIVLWLYHGAGFITAQQMTFDLVQLSATKFD